MGDTLVLGYPTSRAISVRSTPIFWYRLYTRHSFFSLKLAFLSLFLAYRATSAGRNFRVSYNDRVSLYYVFSFYYTAASFEATSAASSLRQRERVNDRRGGCHLRDATAARNDAGSDPIYAHALCRVRLEGLWVLWTVPLRIRTGIDYFRIIIRARWSKNRSDVSVTERTPRRVETCGILRCSYDERYATSRVMRQVILRNDDCGVSALQRIILKLLLFVFNLYWGTLKKKFFSGYITFSQAEIDVF